MTDSEAKQSREMSGHNPNLVIANEVKQPHEIRVNKMNPTNPHATPAQPDIDHPSLLRRERGR